MKNKVDERFESLKLEIKETIKELEYASDAFYNAEPEFIESATLRIKSLNEKLNALYGILHRDYPDL